MNIYVGNLPYSVTDSDLRETFSRFGDVSQVSLVTDRFSGESKGFGFVEIGRRLVPIGRSVCPLSRYSNSYK